MTISKSSFSLVAGLVLAFGASVASASETPSTTASAPVATETRAVHFGLVPFGGERTLDVRGVSLSLIADRVGRFSGVQLSPGLSLTHEASRGVQLSGAVNLAGSDVCGVQSSGAFNLAQGTVTGAQLAGAVNVAGGTNGLQLAPVNVAGSSRGLQLGVVNVATRTATGVQLGVVNAAVRSRGFTFGLINVADEHDGEAFGLFNFIGNGIHDVAVYSTETMLSNASVKLGGRHLYTSWSIGFNPGDKATGRPMTLGKGDRRLGVGMGVGYRFDLGFGRLQFLEIEAAGMSVQSKLDLSDTDDAPLLTAARAIFGIELSREVTLIAGISENVTIATGGRDLDLARGGLEKVFRSGKTTVRMYPGLLLGLQL